MGKENNIKQSDLESIQERLEKLERVILSKDTTKQVGPTKKGREFSGITGGLRLLAAQNFLKRGRSLSEIREELRKREYHSSPQAVQTALNRLSKPGGPIIAFKEKGKKVYAKRK